VTPDEAPVRLTVNGTEHELVVPARLSLADALRERLHLTGTHLGCEHGVCGACTVLVDGDPVRSCITLAAACEGREVVTVEGLAGPVADAVRKAFSAEHGLQCGFCTAGMLVTAVDVVTRLPEATPDDIRLERGVGGDLVSGIVGAVAVPHAPQFFTLPDTEDHDQVQRVHDRMAAIGERLRALEPDVVIAVANDHLDNFALHCVPPFTVHCGPEARGSFAGRDFAWPIPSGTAAGVLRSLQGQGFDPAYTMNATIGYEFGIPLTFLGFDAGTPVLPIFVNSYLPPQPSGDRCYAFGAALRRATDELGLRAVVVASGGLSHYPGTDQYGSPDVEGDRQLMDRIAAGNLRALLALDDAALDRTGNVEARSWLILAGAVGEAVPDEVALEPSWHHVYAIAAWTGKGAAPATPASTTTAADAALHYPMPDPDQLALYEALYALRSDRGATAAFLADPGAFADGYDIDAAARAALVALDEPALRGMGVHPLLGFLARLEVDLARRARGAPSS
jgi:2,3-dihydroxyphenylpropionate 1,2-dioxygenase